MSIFNLNFGHKKVERINPDRGDSRDNENTEIINYEKKLENALAASSAEVKEEFKRVESEVEAGVPEGENVKKALYEKFKEIKNEMEAPEKKAA